jgi:hypothetical protein
MDIITPSLEDATSLNIAMAAGCWLPLKQSWFPVLCGEVDAPEEAEEWVTRAMSGLVLDENTEIENEDYDEEIYWAASNALDVFICWTAAVTPDYTKDFARRLRSDK